jgi:diadenylate cyclase
MSWLLGIQVPELREYVEIALLAVIFYYTLLFFRGTRGAAVLTGFVLFLVGMIFVTKLLNLDAVSWLLQRFSVYLALAFLIIFQPEIRRALAELGKQHVFSTPAGERTMVDAVVQAAGFLAERKIGALVGIEREIGTRSIQETGTRLDTAVSADLLSTIFFPNTPLHDGGVIIADNRIAAAGCLFPLSQNLDAAPPDLGMRHRAALGLSEETDALVVVVSEETGILSVAYRGHLSRDFDEERLRRLLSKVLLRGRRARSTLSRVKEQLDLTPEGVAKTDEMKAEQGQKLEG